MILVLCGTQKQDFSRMLNQVQKLKTFDENIYVQKGHSIFEDEEMNVFDFLPKSKLQDLYDKSDLIITHAGAGSLIDGIKKEKPIISFPRLKKYHEHVNDHQTELAKKFSELNYIRVCHDGDDLIAVYKELMNTKLSKWNLTSNVENIISDFIK